MLRIVKVILEGVFWGSVGIGLLWLTLPSDFLTAKPANPCGLFENEFARRWDGSCTGWTESLAGFHVASDLLLWIAYTTISLVMWRLHPIIKRVPTARITVPLICTVFLTCGATHLFSAYVVVNPIYVFDGAFKTFAGVIGAFAAVYIAHDLVSVFDVIETEHQRLRVLESKLAGRSGVESETETQVGQRSPRGRICRAIFEGVSWSLLGLLLFLIPTTAMSEGLFRNNFASQWTGTCTGWTKPLAMLYVVGSLITWCAYVLIGIVVFRLHPRSRRVRMARIMVPVVSAVLVTCGSVHLVEAYAIFNPIFVALGCLKLFVAVVSLAGAVLVSQSLVKVFDAAARERERLLKLEQQLKGTD